MNTEDLNRCDKDGLYVTDKHVFFFGSVFSNFYATPITYSYFDESGLHYEKTHQFFCSEQAFMWHKAIFFGDNEVAENILKEKSDPYACKKLGRAVRGYDDKKWEEIRYDVFLAINKCKFKQNDGLKKFILQDKFEGKIFVEASPYDKIWGIKRAIGYPDIDDESTWQGRNLLGKCLTEVREWLKNQKKVEKEDEAN